MQEYLSDPARIVYACWDHDDITPMGDGIFRMKFTGQNFLSVSIDLSVDIKLRVEQNGKILCNSVGYSVEDMAKLLGQEFVDTFFLELEGELRVEELETKVRALTLKSTLLSGDVGVTVGGKVRSSFCPSHTLFLRYTQNSTEINIPSPQHDLLVLRLDDIRRSFRRPLFYCPSPLRPGIVGMHGHRPLAWYAISQLPPPLTPPSRCRCSDASTPGGHA